MRIGKQLLFIVFILSVAAASTVRTACAGDLAEIRATGVLRHLGIPYANFVTGAGDGMDVELMQKFAHHLGVRYEFVKTDWTTVIRDLTGENTVVAQKEYHKGVAPVKGDLIANGFTILPARQKVVTFSRPTFPSQVWLVARADSQLKPIKPTANIDRDIEQVKTLLKGRKVLALKGTCLDPDLHGLGATGAEVICFTGKLNELAPAIINNEAESTILDVPDALMAMEKWSGRIKIIGPISQKQKMGVAFPKESHKLQAAFDNFLSQIQKDGTYDKLVKKYYPTAFAFFPDFFVRR